MHGAHTGSNRNRTVMPTALEELSDCVTVTHTHTSNHSNGQSLKHRRSEVICLHVMALSVHCLHLCVHVRHFLVDLIRGMSHPIQHSPRLCPRGQWEIISPWWLTLTISFNEKNYSLDICATLVHFRLCPFPLASWNKTDNASATEWALKSSCIFDMVA